MKNMEPSTCLRILHPVALFFKEKEVLATHPPSCHPRRVFGCPESERKLGKMGVTEIKREKLKASHHFIDEQKWSPITMFSWAYILHQNNTYYQINKSSQLLQGQNGKKSKEEQKGKNSNGQQE